MGGMTTDGLTRFGVGIKGGAGGGCGGGHTGACATGGGGTTSVGPQHRQLEVESSAVSSGCSRSHAFQFRHRKVVIVGIRSEGLAGCACVGLLEAVPVLSEPVVLNFSHHVSRHLLAEVGAEANSHGQHVTCLDGVSDLPACGALSVDKGSASSGQIGEYAVVCWSKANAGGLSG